MFAGFARVSSIVCAALSLALVMAHPSLAQAPSATAPFVTVEGDRKGAAWWVLAEFHPFTTEVRGIPVSQIQKEWCKATEFRKDLFPKDTIFEYGSDEMKASNRSFAVEGNFDGSATKQVALTGVYEECGGQKGNFILVLDQPINTRKPRIRFIGSTPTNHQFLAVEKYKGQIVAWSCMECDGRSILQWDRKKRKFDWLPEPDEE